jgi:hypothetical protein
VKQSRIRHGILRIDSSSRDALAPLTGSFTRYVFLRDSSTTHKIDTGFHTLECHTLSKTIRGACGQSLDQVWRPSILASPGYAVRSSPAEQRSIEGGEVIRATRRRFGTIPRENQKT